MSSDFADGRQCVLVPMSEQYLEAHVRFLNDPDVSRYLRLRPAARALECQRTWLKKVLASERDQLLAILAKESHNAFIGVVHLREIDHVDKIAHGGMVVGNKQFWGKGVGREARLLQLKGAFDTLDLRWVYGRTVRCNRRARTLMEKTGYRLQGVRPAGRLVDGVYEDELLYGVCRETWEVVWKKYLDG